MKKNLIIAFLTVFFILISLLFLVRFTLGGDEDFWICVDNTWVKHGSPSAQKPVAECGK